MLICIDAGHGLYTAGKRCLKSIDSNETREWVLNARIADRLVELLSGYDCETMRVDDPTGETDIPLLDRVKAANRAKADVYVSIHHNAGIKGGSGGGIVVFAARNASEESVKLQESVYRHTVALTGLKGNRSDGLPVKDLYVLRNTKMPAVLGEFGFMDSTSDTPDILTPEHTENTAQGILDALREVYDPKENTDMDYETWKKYMAKYRAELAAQPATLTTHVEEAKEMGITDGSRPMDVATRQEVMTMVKNGMFK